MMSNTADKEDELSQEARAASVAAELEGAVASLTTQLREYFTKRRIPNSPGEASDKPNDDPYHTLDI